MTGPLGWSRHYWELYEQAKKLPPTPGQEKILRILKKTLKWLLLTVAALIVILVAVGVVVAATTPGPQDSPGWERLADMPSPRGETATTTAVVDGAEHLVVAGGIARFGGSVATVSVYDVEADEWSDGPDLPRPRDHAAAAAIGDTVYVSGGSQGVTAARERTLWSWRVGDDDWVELADMPGPRWGHGMVAYDGNLYVIGGHAGDGQVSATVLVYDPDADGWEVRAEMPAPRDHVGVEVVDDRIWAVGGRSGGRNFAQVDIYDPEADTWEDGPALPEPTSGMAIGVIGSTVHVVGGEDWRLRGEIINVHFAIDPGDRSWRSEPEPLVAVHGVPGAVADDRLMIPGGSRRQGGLSILGWTGILQAFGG